MGQITNELTYDRHNMAVFVEDILCKTLPLYLKADPFPLPKDAPSDRPDLYEVYNALLEVNLTKCLARLHAELFKAKTCTVQQLVGIAYNFVKVDMPYRRCVGASLILAYFAESPFVKEELRKGQQTLFHCIDLPADLQAALDNFGYPLPFVEKPRTVKNNDANGHYTYDESVFMGHKHHEFPVSYDHLNRMNNVLFAIDERLWEFCQPHFSLKSKVKKNGEFETDHDIAKRCQAFADVTGSLVKRMPLINPKKFRLVHGYDTRGRTYCKAYEFSYQGTDFQKAMIGLHEQELIEPIW